MVESRGPESPFLTPKRVLKYQISVINSGTELDPPDYPPIIPRPPPSPPPIIRYLRVITRVEICTSKRIAD